ncbi:MAG: glycoside hydrolase family 75 protein, partial [Chthoniobacterales bacterium]
GNHDPNKCKALFHLPGGAVFWSSKMAVDADGPAAPDDPRRKTGKELDPGAGQNGTAFSLPHGRGDLPSEITPYIVLPGNKEHDSTGPFHPALSMGDVAVVIYKDRKTAAICGDIGPFHKIGEGSIGLHQELMPAAPDPCRMHRDQATGFCTRIFDASIDDDVLFFVFPGSAFGDDLELSHLLPDPAGASRLRERAFALFDQLRGAA